MKTTSRKSRQPADTLRNSQAAIEQRFGPIQYRSPAALQAYANNPRKHSEKQIVQLTASISEFGFAIPVLVDETGTIIAGEARVTAAARLGMSEVPVLVAEHWSKAQVKAYRLADNRLSEGATWDLDLLRIEIAGIIEIGEVPVEIMGWNTAEIDVVLDGVDEPGADPADGVPDAPEVPVSQLGDLWQLGSHRLLCASSLEPDNWATLLAGKTAAMAFTDAPFNVPVQGHVSGLGKARHAEFAMASGEMSREEFTKFNLDYLTNLAASSRDGAIVMAVMDWRHLSEILAAAEQAKLKLINLCVWQKLSGGMGSLYRSQHELVLILKKGSAPHTNNVELGRQAIIGNAIFRSPNPCS